MDITRVSDLEGFINITCHFAQGSVIKGCKIIIISQTADNGTNKTCEYIATREEGSLEALIQVILPAGHYRVEVYDDEDMAVRNFAYNNTLNIASLSMMQNSGMCNENYIQMRTNLYTQRTRMCSYSRQHRHTHSKQGE